MRLLLVAGALGLGTALIATVPTASPTAWADEDNQPVVIDDSDDPQDIDNTVEGIVYNIFRRQGVMVVTVFDLNVSQEGAGVDLYVRDPGLLEMIEDDAICVGRYIEAVGVRTGPTSMNLEGVTVDYSTDCHNPPE
jgi:hypothetical protein